MNVSRWARPFLDSDATEPQPWESRLGRRTVRERVRVLQATSLQDYRRMRSLARRAWLGTLIGFALLFVFAPLGVPLMMICMTVALCAGSEAHIAKMKASISPENLEEL